MVWCWKSQWWWTVMVTLLSSAILCHGLKCYTCSNAKSNAECSRQEHIVDCEEMTKANDACSTSVSYKAGEGLTIDKKCVLRPCHGQKVLQQLQDSTDCDSVNTGGESWSCFSCCSTDECNKSSGAKVVLSVWLGAACLLLVTTVRHAV